MPVATLVVAACFFALGGPVNRLGRRQQRWSGIAWLLGLLVLPAATWVVLSHLARFGRYGGTVGAIVSYVGLWSGCLCAGVVRKAATTLGAWRRHSP